MDSGPRGYFYDGQNTGGCILVAVVTIPLHENYAFTWQATAPSVGWWTARTIMRTLLLVLALAVSARANTVTVNFSGTWDHLCSMELHVTCASAAGLITVGESFSGSLVFDFDGGGQVTPSFASWSTVPDTSINYHMGLPYPMVNAPTVVTFSEDGNFQGAAISAHVPGMSLAPCSEYSIGPGLNYILMLGPTSAQASCRDDYGYWWTRAYATNFQISSSFVPQVLSLQVASPEPRWGVLTLSVALAGLLVGRRFLRAACRL